MSLGKTGVSKAAIAPPETMAQKRKHQNKTLIMLSVKYGYFLKRSIVTKKDSPDKMHNA